MHSTKGSSHPESMSSHERRKQEIRQETLKTNYSNDSSKNILPGNKDDSASETTGEHSIVNLLVIAFVSPPSRKSSSGARNLRTDKQTDNPAP